MPVSGVKEPPLLRAALCVAWPHAGLMESTAPAGCPVSLGNHVTRRRLLEKTRILNLCTGFAFSQPAMCACRAAFMEQHYSDRASASKNREMKH